MGSSCSIHPVKIVFLGRTPRHGHPDVEFIERARRELASVDSIPTLEEVRQMLSKDKSSWADYIIAEREDRL